MVRRRGVKKSRDSEAQMLSSRASSEPQSVSVRVCVCVCVWLFSFKTCILSTIPIG